ncbi:hypothetical protein Lser_V15G18944 [Lactuca serriola]
MHRSSSSTRVSGDFSHHRVPLAENYRPGTDETGDELPTYNPRSYIATKKHNQIRSAEAAIHLIPLLLVICAMILWLFSDKESLEEKASRPNRLEEKESHLHWGLDTKERWERKPLTQDS